MRKSMTSKSQFLTKRMQQYATAEHPLLLRNLAFGGGAACLAILLGLIQLHVDFQKTPLSFTVIALAVGMPMSILLGSIYENYVLLGQQSYPHRLTPFANRFIGLVGSFVAISIFISVLGIFCSLALPSSPDSIFLLQFMIPLWNSNFVNLLMHNALWIFVTASVVSLLLSNYFFSELANWWHGKYGSQDGNENVEASKVRLLKRRLQRVKNVSRKYRTGIRGPL